MSFLWEFFVGGLASGATKGALHKSLYSWYMTINMNDITKRVCRNNNHRLFIEFTV